MDSINQQQIEDTRADLQGGSAISKIAELASKAQTCFFTTHPRTGQEVTRPMSVQEVDEAGALWFLSANDSHKNAELELNPAVTLYFQGSPHSDFLQLHGQVFISRDPARIRELWKFAIKTWFTEGVDDPRITVLKVVPSHGYYWDTKHGNAVAGIKILLGAVLGKTLDDSVEGTLAV